MCACGNAQPISEAQACLADLTPSSCPTQNLIRSSSAYDTDVERTASLAPAGYTEEIPFCRICLDTVGEMISPCRCKGSLQNVHRSCLRKWQVTTHSCQTYSQRQQRENVCPMCRSSYKGVRTGPPVLRSVKGIIKYLQHEVAPKLVVVAVGYMLDRSIKRILPQVYVSTSVNMALDYRQYN
mmetsp:Transcript_4053/g.7555  ORF Transcript_4053/g.7555 Transcript_4053/m.7555 type:complete len:182 (-) Transcript_4053:710-1255(-)